MRDLYFADDIERTRTIFEFCSDIVYEKLGYHVSREEFITNFMNSEMRKAMDNNHPRLLSQCASDSIVLYLNEENPALTKRQGSTVDDFNPYELYWIGEMYVRLARGLQKPSSQIFIEYPLEIMRHFYVTGHQISMLRAYENITGESFKINNDDDE